MLVSMQPAGLNSTLKPTLIFSLVGLLWVSMQHKQAELQALPKHQGLQHLGWHNEQTHCQLCTLACMRQKGGRKRILP